MSEQSLNEQFNRLFKTTQDGIDKIKKAWEEKDTTFDNWECINNGVLDFNLIEKDITKIQEKIKQSNAVIRNTQFIVNELNKFIEIKTYTQEGDKFFEYTSKGKFESLINLPSDLETELKNNGRVTVQPILA